MIKRRKKARFRRAGIPVSIPIASDLEYGIRADDGIAVFTAAAKIRYADDNRPHVPPIWMSRHVHCQIMSTVGTRVPETGGILLGPIGANDITDFYFDTTAACSRATYSPDHITLRRKMRELWMPSGFDMKGFVHSHPGRFAQLSQGDLVYIRRLLEINPDMTVFAAPIVIPCEFRIQPIVVLASDPHTPRPTTLKFF